MTDPNEKEQELEELINDLRAIAIEAPTVGTFNEILEEAADSLAAKEEEIKGWRNKWGGSISAHPFMVEQVRQNNELHSRIKELEELVKKLKETLEEPHGWADLRDIINESLQLIEELEKKT